MWKQLVLFALIAIKMVSCTLEVQLFHAYACRRSHFKFLVGSRRCVGEIAAIDGSTNDDVP
jgi:hypothetical protein